ncbi:MAG: ABC transporter permease subunit [Ignavibacteriales bacterium]|nr:ABC transporter permease subunit [Ignavibacteriales bacterium]
MPNNQSIISKVKLAVVLLFVYVVLFEFVLPVNKILPKPDLLFESLIAVWKDYNLLQSAAATTTIIYLSLALAYFIFVKAAPLLMKFFAAYNESAESLKIFRYFPAFFFAILFSFWFGDSFLAEFLFAVIVSFLMFSFSLYRYSGGINESYKLTAKNLGVAGNSLYSKVLFKSIQPKIFDDMRRTHYYIWVLIMIYEFISNAEGFGGVYRQALNYNDFSALFSIAVIISLLILLGDLVYKIIREKIYFWQ